MCVLKQEPKSILRVKMQSRTCLWATPPHKGGMCTSADKYGPPRGASPTPTCTFVSNFSAIFGTKLVSITFFLRPEEALLALILQKLACIQMHILFCYIGLSLSF